MILPISCQNAREAAQCAQAQAKGIARLHGLANSRDMVIGQTRDRTCNSIFRYPSPSGCSESVPLGTPAFFLGTLTPLRNRQIVAKTGATGGIRFSCAPKQAICASEAENRKGGSSWKTSNSRFWARQWCSGWRPAVTRGKSKPLSAPVQGQPRQLWLAGAGWQVRPSAVRPTSSTARKTPASVNTLIFWGAEPRPHSHHKAIVSSAGVGGFFVSMSPRAALGQDQEGTSNVR